MKQIQININDSKLTISAKKPPLLIRIVLALFLLILFLIPLAGTVFSLTYADGLQIGLIFSFILFWGVGFYLLRLILWNSFGQEVLTMNSEKILYFADYRLYKVGRQEIGTKGLVTEIIYDDEPNKSLGRLILKNKAMMIETVLQAPINELEELKSELETRYNK